jgi:hypothetical protein
VTPTHRLARPVVGPDGTGYPVGHPVKLVTTDSDGMAIVNVSFYVESAYPELVRVRLSCLELIPPREEPPAC